MLPNLGICFEMKIKDKIEIPPIADDELVVVVIGGPSQGESVLLHYGDGRWLIVDSCKSDGQNLPLLFLEKAEADLSKVGFVVCSHWHDDHVKGLNEILKECENAYFMIPCVTHKSILPRYFEYRIQRTEKEKEKEAWREFKRCTEVVNGRTNVENPNLKELQFMKVESPIFDYETHGTTVSAKALSPSNEMMNLFGQMLADGEARNYQFDDSDINQNMCSIAIGVKFAGQHIFLGADLECNREDDEDEETCVDKCNDKFSLGMCNAVSNRYFREMSPYCYTKLNHHSSKNGYCPKYWLEHVTENRVAVSTVFTPQSLPRKEMASRYLAKNSRYFVTSRKSQKKLQKNNVKKVLGDDKNITSIEHIYSAPGIVLTRYDITTGVLKSTETYLNAFQMQRSDLKYFKVV